MTLFRASELDRLMECPGSAWLPRKADYTGLAAAWGNMVHAWVETGVVEDSNDGKLLQKRIDKAAVQRETLYPAGGEHEVPLAFNLVTEQAVRYPNPPLPPGVTRKAHVDAWKRSFGDEWFTGSVDYVGELLDSWWIDDLKTGRDVTWGKYTWQQTAYALAWSKFKYGTYTNGRSTITHWPRYPSGRPPNRMGAVLDTEWLKKALDKFRQLRVDILAQRPESLETGEHCYFCPSSGVCPKLNDRG